VTSRGRAVPQAALQLAARGLKVHGTGEHGGDRRRLWLWLLLWHRRRVLLGATVLLILGTWWWSLEVRFLQALAL
jgi:hypothetical protein